MERVGDRVEPAAHLHLGVVGHVVRAVGLRAEQRGDGRAREVLGVDVIGVDVVVRHEHGRALPDPVERQPGLGIDARRAQDRQRDAVAPRPVAQPVLGRDAAARARRAGAARPRLGDARAGAIAVDARRRNVDESLWYASRPRQRGDQLLRARIVAALGRRRREMQDGERRRAQAVEAREPVEVADDGNDAVRAQLRDILDAAREPVEAHLGMEQAGGAQCDVAAADQQYPDHLLATRVLRARCTAQDPRPASSPCRTRLP